MVSTAMETVVGMAIVATEATEATVATVVTVATVAATVATVVTVVTVVTVATVATVATITDRGTGRGKGREACHKRCRAVEHHCRWGGSSRSAVGRASLSARARA